MPLSHHFKLLGCVTALIGTGFQSMSARADEPTAATVQTDPPELESALEQFAAKDYASAAKSFRHAFEKKPSPDYLYAWAQSERLSGQCAAAIPVYEQFLATESSGANAEVARINLVRCKSQIAPVITVVSPAPPEAWWKDAPGAMVVGASAAAFAASGAFKLAADRAARDREQAQSYDVFASREEAMRRWDQWATGAMIAGTAFFITGAVRYGWRALRRQ